MSKARQPVPAIENGMSIIDSHCHLDMADYNNDLDLVLSRALDHGVKGVVTIGIDLLSSHSAIDIAKQYNFVRATVGIHPHEAASASKENLDTIGVLAQQNKEVVGYGEIGLDYVKKYADPHIQRAAFTNQLQLAKELKLPIIIHDREAHDDCLKLIRSEGPFDCGGIMHCFSGDLEFAKKIIDCNLHISIPGIVTYKKAESMQRVAAEIPLERMLVETDGPFLAPAPYRGKRNEPLFSIYTADTIARLRQTTLKEIAEQTTVNCCKLFNYRFGC